MHTFATTESLAQELVSLIKTADAALAYSYYVFSTAELEEYAPHVTPGNYLAGVTYEGSTPVRKDQSGLPKYIGVPGAFLETKKFLVVVTIPYRFADCGQNTKSAGTDLLDQIKAVIAGNTGTVNSRPWRFLGEVPLETRLEGVVMYAQGWDTTVPVSNLNKVSE